MFLAYDRHSISNTLKLDILVEIKENDDCADVAAFCCVQGIWTLWLVQSVFLGKGMDSS